MSESRFETEKETLERRLKNAIESNEILRSDRDHFKVECANREMEEHRLKDEVNALKDDCIRLQQEILYRRMEPCQLKHCVKERDALKAEVKELREWAKRVEGPPELPHEPSTTDNRRARIAGLERECIKNEAEISRLRAELETYRDGYEGYVEASAIAKKWIARAAKYREWIEKKGHEAECFELTKEGYGIRCQCGLEAALSEEMES